MKNNCIKLLERLFNHKKKLHILRLIFYNKELTDIIPESILDEIDSTQPSALGLALLLKLKYTLDTTPINKTDIENLCCLSQISIYKDKNNIQLFF